MTIKTTEKRKRTNFPVIHNQIMRIALKPGIPGQYDDHVQQNHASHQL